MESLNKPKVSWLHCRIRVCWLLGAYNLLSIHARLSLSESSSLCIWNHLSFARTLGYLLFRGFLLPCEGWCSYFFGKGWSNWQLPPWYSCTGAFWTGHLLGQVVKGELNRLKYCAHLTCLGDSFLGVLNTSKFLRSVQSSKGTLLPSRNCLQVRRARQTA